MKPEILRDFIAMQYYKLDCKAREVLPIRWGVLREDIKERFISISQAHIRDWAEDEESARARRDEGYPPRSLPKA